MTKEKTESEDIEKDEDTTDVSVPPKKGKRVLLLLIPIILAILGASIFAALHFFGNKSDPGSLTPTSAASKDDFSYINVDDIIVTLSSSNSKKSFLKISVSLQFKNKQTADLVNAKLPIIKDSFQVFLRELRSSDLSGSAGVLMLKVELMKRINKIISPEEVLDVLFKEILLS